MLDCVEAIYFLVSLREGVLILVDFFDSSLIMSKVLVACSRLFNSKLMMSSFIESNDRSLDYCDCLLSVLRLSTELFRKSLTAGIVICCLKYGLIFEFAGIVLRIGAR